MWRMAIEKNDGEKHPIEIDVKFSAELSLNLKSSSINQALSDLREWLMDSKSKVIFNDKATLVQVGDTIVRSIKDMGDGSFGIGLVVLGVRCGFLVDDVSLSQALEYIQANPVREHPLSIIFSDEVIQYHIIKCDVERVGYSSIPTILDEEQRIVLLRRTEVDTGL